MSPVTLLYSADLVSLGGPPEVRHKLPCQQGMPPQSDTVEVVQPSSLRPQDSGHDKASSGAVVISLVVPVLFARFLGKVAGLVLAILRS